MSSLHRPSPVTAAVVVFLCAAAASAQHRMSPNNLAPFVPTPEPVVEKMLEAGSLKPGETLYDLGCGDGRILFTAAQKFGARAVGVELSAKLVKGVVEKVQALGLQNQIQVIEGNLLDVDLRSADVVTLYLMRLTNEKLKPILRKQLKPGARVISHDYEIMGWKPERVDRVVVYQRPHAIFVYRMPPVE
ncbi:MAG: cyclopropane-fatty-acyl-phospholipid synthase family protein [Bryobacteraceae bacterium]